MYVEMLQPCPRRSEKAAVENHGAEYIMHDATFIGALSYIKLNVRYGYGYYRIGFEEPIIDPREGWMLVSTRRVV